jgi:hypothetical protein
MNSIILHIKGVTQADVEARDNSAMRRNRTIDQIVTSTQALIKRPLEKPVTLFTDLSTWPRATTLPCKNCTLCFDNVPFPLPRSIIIADNLIVSGRTPQQCPIIYECISYFCSPICASKFNKRYFKPDQALINDRRILEVYNGYFKQLNGDIQYKIIPDLDIEYHELDIYSGVDGESLGTYQDKMTRYYAVKYNGGRL